MEDTSVVPWIDTAVMNKALTPTGLTPGTTLTLEEEALFLDADRKITSAMRWTRADIALAHEDDQKAAERIAKLCGKTYATIIQDRWVAKAYPYQFRVADASFEHHKVLLQFGVDLPTRHEYLLMAAAEGMSAGEMLAWIMGEMYTTTSSPTSRTQVARWFRNGYGLNVTTNKTSIEFQANGTVIIANFIYDDGPGIEWEIAHDMES